MKNKLFAYCNINIVNLKATYFRIIASVVLCICIVVGMLPQNSLAAEGDQFTYTDEDGVKHTITWGGDDNTVFSWDSTWGSSNGTQTGSGHSSNLGSLFQYTSAATVDEVIEICKKYSDRETVTGVRNQIDWMKQLYVTAVQGFNSKLSLGDTLLIALLNHTDINTTLMTSSYSMGDINRVIAKQISESKKGYVDIATIAKATGLSAHEVKEIISRIASGSITEKTIAAGKNSSQHTNRGPYLKKQALKQEKVFTYLSQEIERMATDSNALALLCNDLGEGYVNGLLSGTPIDQYKVKLYKEHLAKTLDNTIEGIEINSDASKIAGTEAYKVTKKTKSALSKVYSYMVNAEETGLSPEVKSFLDEHLKNGKLSDSEARELLILSGEYEKGEHGIGEAAKQLIKGYEHLQKLENAFEVSGKVFDAVDKIKKGEEFIEYWLTDYAQQEVLLDYMVQNLSDSGADMELMVAAKELQNEYADKLSGTFDKVYTELINKGIGTVKSAFPPLGIAESCIS